METKSGYIGVKTKKLLIVNADDFGLNKEINEGVVMAHTNGIVTSASLLVNREGFGDALEKIKENPDLDIGLHLNVFRGKPVGNLSYLVDVKGNFSESCAVFMLKCLLNKKKAAREISDEFNAQIIKAKQNGVNISHLDTEKHIHSIPFILKIIMGAAERHKVAVVRRLREKKVSGTRIALKQRIKLFFVNFLYMIKGAHIWRNGEIKGADNFYGISLSGKYFADNLKYLIGNIGPGVSELSCHPGMCAKKGGSYIDVFRKQEFDALVCGEIKSLLREKGVELENFRAYK